MCHHKWKKNLMQKTTGEVAWTQNQVSLEKLTNMSNHISQNHTHLIHIWEMAGYLGNWTKRHASKAVWVIAEYIKKMVKWLPWQLWKLIPTERRTIQLHSDLICSAWWWVHINSGPCFHGTWHHCCILQYMPTIQLKQSYWNVSGCFSVVMHFCWMCECP